MSPSAISPTFEALESAPPIVIRDLPSGETLRVRRSAPSSTSPPASSTFSASTSSISKFADTRVRSDPVRTRSESDLAPRTKPSAVSTIVFPAPVSPVRTVNPGENSTFALSITPRPRIEISVRVELRSLLLDDFSLTAPTFNGQLKFCNKTIGESSLGHMNEFDRVGIFRDRDAITLEKLECTHAIT